MPCVLHTVNHNMFICRVSSHGRPRHRQGPGWIMHRCATPEAGPETCFPEVVLLVRQVSRCPRPYTKLPSLYDAQWFSPLGSSATRIMPAGESTPPAPDGCSNGSSSSSQPRARPGTSPSGNPFGAWPPEQAAPAATPAAAGAQRTGSADSASSAGSRGAQQSAAAAALNTARGSADPQGTFWSTPTAGDAISDEQLGEAAAASSQGAASQQPHAAMGAMGRKQGGPFGQWACAGAPHADVALPGLSPPVAKEASPWGQPGHKAALLDGQQNGAGQPPSAPSPLAEHPAAKGQPVLLSQNGGLRVLSDEQKHGALQAELSALKQQVCRGTCFGKRVDVCLG